jgi:phage gp29-like protein
MTAPAPRPSTVPDPRVYKDLPVTPWTGSWGTASIQKALDAHDYGQFLLSSQLAESVQRDDRVATALNTRAQGLLGLPLLIEPSPEGDPKMARRAADDLAVDLAETDVVGSLVQILRWKILLGFDPSEIVWEGDAEHWRFSLRPWHPQWSWYDWYRRLYVITTAEGLVEIVPGGGKWMLLTPEHPYRAWIQGAIRSIAIPWLGRQYAFRDWMKFNEVYGQPIRKAKTPSQTPDEDKDRFFNSIANAGSSLVVECPQGIDGQAYDVELLEATATAWETFKNATEDCDKRITLALLGQNLTTEVQGGSLAAAKVHGQVRQDYLEADARGLERALRVQVLRLWAQYNYGDPDLAPVVRFATEPPEDAKASADTLMSVSTAMLNLGQFPEVDRRALLGQFGVPLRSADTIATDPAPAPTPPQGPLAAPALHRAHALSAVRPPRQAAAAQDFVDDAGSLARDQAARVVSPALKRVLSAIESAGSYDEIRAALGTLTDDLNVDELGAVTERLLQLAHLAGRYAVESLPED